MWDWPNRDGGFCPSPHFQTRLNEALVLLVKYSIEGLMYKELRKLRKKLWEKKDVRHHEVFMFNI